MESEERFYHLIREASVGIVVLSGEKMVVSMVNAAYGKLIDRTVTELTGKPLFDIIPDAEAPFRALLEGVRTTGKPLYLYGHPYKVYSRDKKIEGYLDIIYQPYTEADGSISGVMALCHDVTERIIARRKIEEAEARARKVIEEAAEQLTRQVREQTSELQRSNGDLLQFAHVISHDLKEPVRKIKIYAGRIRDELGDVIPDKALLYLAKIQHAAIRMSDMIQGVLTYSSVDTSHAPLESVDLNVLMQSIEADLELLINQKSAVLIRGQLPRIAGVPILIYQLFYNLIINSLKFSKKDVAPCITITAQEEEFGVVRIEIADNGIGFEQQYAVNIFHSFTRLHSKDAFEGSGLGLALCKKIVERHGGTITASGWPGKGATMTLSLPSAKEKFIK